MDNTELDKLLGKLEERVRGELEREYGERRSDPELARLAADYRSYVRMGHPPARAQRVADQLLFGHRDYGADEATRQRVALEVTAALARIYEGWLERGT